MADRYFVYKLCFIQGIGGVQPKPSATMQMGMACMPGEWILGKIDESELSYLDKIREYSPILCSKNVADGIPLMFVDELPVESEEMAMEPEMRPLNAEELADKAAALAFYAKLLVRPPIEVISGDTPDQIADLAKRLTIIERALAHMFDKMETSTEIPADYVSLLTQYVTDLKNSDIRDPIDVRTETIMQIYEKLKARSNALTDIMASYYSQGGTGTL